MISRSDYVNLLLRTKRKDAAPPSTGTEREADLHNAISEYCRAKGWLCFTGSMAHRAWRTLGEPDFIILLPAGRVLLVEAKTRTGKLSVEQQGVAMMAERLGHTVHVVRSMEEFLKLTL